VGADTKIQWAHHTFNPWRGCTHVSPGCENCYAEALSKRNPAQLGTWGAGGERVIASESYWRQPERWNRAAERAHRDACRCMTSDMRLHSYGCPAARWERPRVFCASLADVFEDRGDLWAPRVRLMALIQRTPHLDWLLLTKRPDNARKLLGSAAMWEEADWALSASGADPDTLSGDVWPLPNVWLGTTVEDQRRADERIPILLDTPAAVRFLSCEPLLGPVDVARWTISLGEGPGYRMLGYAPEPRIDWLIVGGESGPRARPMDLAWARSLVEQGRAAGVPVFVKQLGRRPYAEYRDHFAKLDLRHSHGGDPDEWPAGLRVREVPR
jgi:protein gp37